MTDDAAVVSVTALRRILAQCASSTGEATGDLGMATASGGHERLEGGGTAKPSRQRRMTWGEKDGAAFLIVFLCFYSDDFRAHVRKEISMGGVHMIYLSWLFNDRRSSHAVRTLAATPPGVDSDFILEAIAPDLRVGAKDGWLCKGADGKPVRVYADFCFYVGDYVQVAKTSMLMRPGANTPCTIWSYRFSGAPGPRYGLDACSANVKLFRTTARTRAVFKAVSERAGGQ